MNTASTLISDQPPRVLTPQLREKLAAVTEAQRALAVLGSRVLQQDLRLGTSKRPLLTLDGAGSKVRPLLKAIARIDGARVARFMDVDVSWSTEPAQH